MKSDSASDSQTSRFESAIRDYAPKPSRKFQKLLPLKAGIAELRKRRASYKTIADILDNLNIQVACDTVFRFCHEILGEPKAHYRRKRKTSTPRVRKRPGKDSPTPHALSPGGSPQKADRWTEANGPRIADPNTI
ncbi:MAG: hypothetical protein ABSA97_07215 [Verrucomicrobiia bacterium]